MGLAGGPVFDKLWHLTDSVAAWTLFGRLPHYCWSLSVALLFVSSPFLLLFLTVHRMMVVQKHDGGCQTGHRWLQVWTVEGLGFPNTTSSAWFIHFTAQSESSGYLDSGLITQPSTTSVRVRKLVCGERVRPVSWLSIILSRDEGCKGRPLWCVRCCQDKLILMSSRSVWRPVKLLRCHAPDSDRQNVLSVAGMKWETLTAFWDINE